MKGKKNELRDGMKGKGERREWMGRDEKGRE